MEAIINYCRKYNSINIRYIVIVLRININCSTEWKSGWGDQRFDSPILNLLFYRLERLKNSTTKNLNIRIIRRTILGGKALRGKVILEKIKNVEIDIDVPTFPNELYTKGFKAPRKIILPISVNQLITILNEQKISSNTNKKELLNALLFLKNYNIV